MGGRYCLLLALCLCVSVVSPLSAHPVGEKSYDRTIVVRFTADADESGALDGKPDATSPAPKQRLTQMEGTAGLAA